jgi:hypothetical protein
VIDLVRPAARALLLASLGGALALATARTARERRSLGFAVAPILLPLPFLLRDVLPGAVGSGLWGSVAAVAGLCAFPFGVLAHLESLRRLPVPEAAWLTNCSRALLALAWLTQCAAVAIELVDT